MKHLVKPLVLIRFDSIRFELIQGDVELCFIRCKTCTNQTMRENVLRLVVAIANREAPVECFDYRMAMALNIPQWSGRSGTNRFGEETSRKP